MAKQVLILVGTRKGAFILQSNERRSAWTVCGPLCDAWPINHVVADPAAGTIYAGGGNEWLGPAVWTSADLGETWTYSREGLAYPDEDGSDQGGVERGAARRDAVTLAFEPAGLFRSDDRGRSWEHVAGLRNHPSRPDWRPGGGGLILHSLVPHPTDERQVWVGISTAGVFHTADGGDTWEARNRGTRADFMPEGQRYPEVGQCVHCLVMAPGSSRRLYQQNHCGMYRSDDGGRHWDSIEAGLPSSFGFPAAVHPRDPATLYLVPLNGDMAGRYVPDGKRCGVADTGQRRDLGGAARRLAPGERLLRRAAPGHGDRPTHASRGLFRHQ